MAKKAKTAKKSASSKKTASGSAKSGTRSNTHSGTNFGTGKNPFDFAEMSKQFASPSQFWNLSSMPTFQSANMQQVFEQMIETSQKNLEIMTACTQLAVERAKSMIEEHADFNQRFFAETAATLQEALTSQNVDPREALEELAEYAKEYMEQAASQARKATEENIEIAQQISEKINQRINDSVEEIRTAA